MSTKPPANVTIDDVADYAGVSAMTVSRYLNNTGPVSERTAEKVRAAILKLNYIPHQGARALAANKTNTIGLILPEMSDVFFFQLIHGIQQITSRSQFDLLLYSTTNPDELSVLNLPLGRHNTDGLLIFTDSLNEVALRRLYAIDFPMVLLLRTAPADIAIPSVSFENKDGAYKMVEHLLACGHRRIAFLAGAPENEDAYWRKRGYCEALADHDISYEPQLTAEAGFDELTAYSLVLEWLNQGLSLDAIFAADDVSARGALQAVKSAGKSVPADIAVVGFDDALLSQYTDPPLTTVRAPIEQAGRVAATQLLRIIHGEAADPLTLLSTELVIRQSCGWRQIASGDRDNGPDRGKGGAGR